MQGIVDRFRRQSIAYSLASVVGPGTGILLLPIYTRILSPADYGLIALLEIISLLLGTIFSMGMMAIVPFYYTDRLGEAERRAAMGTLVTAITVLNLALAGLVWLAGPWAIGVALPSLPFHPYVPILILTAFFEPYWAIFAAVAQIQERAYFYSMFSIARIVVSLTLRIVLVVVVPWGVYGFVLANLLTATAAALATFPLLAREMSPRFVPSALVAAMRLGLPTLPNNLLTYGFRGLDRVFLDRFATRGEIGLYYLALRVADVLRMFAEVCISAWRPLFFKEAGDAAFAAGVAPRMMRVLSVAFISAFVGLSLFVHELIALLAPPAYGGAAPFVPVLVAAMALKGIYTFPYLAIWYRRKTMYMPVLTGITLAFSVGANLVLGPRFGAMGVATVLLLSYGLLLALAYFAAKRIYTIAYPWQHVLIAGAMGVTVVTLGTMVGSGLSAFGLRALLLLAYVAALVPTGCIRLSEIRGALSPMSMRDAGEGVSLS